MSGRPSEPLSPPSSERLIMRELRPDDFEALYRVFSDPGISRFYPYDFDEDIVRGWIDRNIGRYRVFGFGLWAVCLRDTGELIGDCGLTMQIIDGQVRPEIGYHIRRDMQRQGYASEAARAVRDWAFEHTPFNEIYSYMQSANIPSRRTAEAYGCRFVREYPDEPNGVSAFYAITRKQWESIVGGE